MDTEGRRFSVLDNCRVTVQAAMSDNPTADTMTVTQKYVNFTGHLIDIKSRLGMNVELQPVRRIDKPECIEIHMEWEMSAHAFRKAVDNMAAKGYTAGSLTSQVIRAIDDRYRHQNLKRQVSAVVVISLLWKDLVKAGGVVYLEDLDLMIAVGESKNRTLDHPFSPNERVRTSLNASIPHLGEGTFVMSIKAVDNNPLRKYQDRFMLVGDVVHHVPIETDDTLETGVYVTMRRSAEDKNETGDDGGVQTHYLSFEEATARYGLTDTIDKAKAGGTWENVFKEKLAERTWQRKVQEEAFKDKAFEREERMSEDRHRQQQEKMREESRKEESKNFADWLRIAASTIAAALSLTTLFAKLKTT